MPGKAASGSFPGIIPSLFYLIYLLPGFNIAICKATFL